MVHHLRKKLSFEARVVLAGTISFKTIKLKEVIQSLMVNGLGVVGWSSWLLNVSQSCL